MTDLVSPVRVDLARQRRPRGVWHSTWLRLLGSSTGRIGLVLSAALLLLAVVVPLASPYNPDRDRDLRNRMLGPTWLLPSAELGERKMVAADHLFGTDELGRDVFTRVVHGAPLSLGVGLFSVFLAVVVGSLLGLTAGFFGGWYDTLAVWVMDILLALPGILLAIAISAAGNSPASPLNRLAGAIHGIPGLGSIYDPPLFNALLAIALVEIPIFGRIARATVLATHGQEYVLAAQAAGAGSLRTLFHHILPNCLSPLLVQGTLSVATAILSLAALGFLGLGAQPPRPEWGTMLASTRNSIGDGRWWLAAFPGLAIMLAVLALNLLGDGLRDALDPRLGK
jgi:peptide/nickel transport system permease protein